MRGKMSALHKLFIDNIDDCKVTLEVLETSYMFTFNYEIQGTLYTIEYELTEAQALKETLHALYHNIRAIVTNELLNLISEDI